MAYDREEDYAKKSLKELISIRDKFRDIISKYPDRTGGLNAHLHWVNAKIAERIGKKK